MVCFRPNPDQWDVALILPSTMKSALERPSKWDPGGTQPQPPGAGIIQMHRIRPTSHFPLDEVWNVALMPKEIGIWLDVEDNKYTRDHIVLLGHHLTISRIHVVPHLNMNPTASVFAITTSGSLCTYRCRGDIFNCFFQLL